MQKNPSERKKRTFLSEYERLSMLQNSCPLPRVINTIKDGFIDINADRIRENEWEAILQSLKVDNSLSRIAVRSSWLVTSSKESGFKKKPVIRSRSVTMKLARSLKECMGVSDCLECVVLQNIPFRSSDVQMLAKGLRNARCLKYLSLEKSRIGDELFAALGESLRRSRSISSINFTGCGLTFKSAVTVAGIIKNQASQLNGEAWKASLRYRKPNFDEMLGLRRITLCENNLGNESAPVFADAIKDDLWLKALDLQQCGFSTEGATILKEALKYNKTLMVLDLRRNPLVEYNVLRSIIELVMVNTGGENTNFPWLSGKEQEKCKNVQSNHKKSSFHRRSYNKNGTRRKSLEHRRASCEHLPRKASENRLITRKERTFSREPINTCDATAVHRALKEQRMHQLQPKHDSSRGTPPNHNSGKKSRRRSKSLVENDLVLEHLDHPTLETVTDLLNSHTKETYLRIIDDLCKEVETYKRDLSEERRKRLQAERQAYHLEKENKNLRVRLNSYKMKNDEKKEISSRVPSMLQFPDLASDSKVLEDDKVLESIESSFKQFQQFLDMLKGIGLGDLCNQLSNVEPSIQVNGDDDQTEL